MLCPYMKVSLPISLTCIGIEEGGTGWDMERNTPNVVGLYECITLNLTMLYNYNATINIYLKKMRYNQL